MSTSISVFKFNITTIRVVMRLGEPWFVAKDVCEVLEVKNVSDALSRLDADEKGIVSVDTSGGKQNVSIVSESGLYALILSSRKDTSKPFRRWIRDLLVSLRKSSEFNDYIESNRGVSNLSGFIYLAMTPNGWCKIGMSKEPYRRMSSLQTGTPLEVTLVHRVFTFNMPALEKALHDYFDAYWMRGEWFNLPKDCIKGFPAIANELDADLELVRLPG